MLAGGRFCLEEGEMSDRRDTKNRKLNKGEYQRADGRYAYRYTDASGKTRWVYSWKLMTTDSAPNGKSAGKCLRDLEIEIARKIAFGETACVSGIPTLNELFENYIFMKRGLRDTTKNCYRCLWNAHVNSSSTDEFLDMRIP